MRRLVTPLIVVAVAGFAMGAVYRYLWDDPNEASVANYLRSGVHGMLVAASGWVPSLFQFAGQRMAEKMAAPRRIHPASGRDGDHDRGGHRGVATDQKWTVRIKARAPTVVGRRSQTLGF